MHFYLNWKFLPPRKNSKVNKQTINWKKLWDSGFVLVVCAERDKTSKNLLEKAALHALDTLSSLIRVELK